MKAKAAEPVKVVVSLLTNRPALIPVVVGRCVERLGPIDFLSESFAFDRTDYYKDELGAGLVRRLVSFERLVAPEELAGIKLFTNSLEEEAAGPDGRRTVNVDPGILSLDKLVLASCKNFSHRIHLRDGVYAELTLIYRHGSFTTLEWTYPDYAGRPLQSALLAVRTRLALARGVGASAMAEVDGEKGVPEPA